MPASQVILITVPHAICPPRTDTEAWLSTGNHACDFCGPSGGRGLETALVARGRTVLRIEADVPRTTLDMNRFWSRGSVWRNQLAARLSVGDVAYLLDAHSYPKGHVPFGDNDLVLYTPGAPAAWQVGLGAAIARNGRFKCGFRESADTTDLIQCAHERGVPAVLIEFCEGLDTAAFREACGRIADYMIMPTAPLVVACHVCGARAETCCAKCRIAICDEACRQKSWAEGMPHRDFCYRRRKREPLSPERLAGLLDPP